MQRYETCKTEAITNQAMALDAIKDEFLRSTQPSIDKLEKQISEITIQQQKLRDDNQEIINKNKALEQQKTVMLSEMSAEFEHIREICEKREQQIRNNKFFVPSGSSNCEKTYEAICTNKETARSNCEVIDMDVTRNVATQKKERDNTWYGIDKQRHNAAQTTAYERLHATLA